jgi:hypothetical protein
MPAAASEKVRMTAASANVADTLAFRHKRQRAAWVDPAGQLPGQPLAAIARKRAIKMTLIGAVIFVIGLVITIATYSAASSGGGTYIVAWGPMIVGLIWTIRGLVSISRASRLG